MYLITLSVLSAAAAISTFPFPRKGDPNLINPVVNATLSGRQIEKRAQCTTTLSECTIIANELQSKYWNTNAGNYNGGGFWDDVNTYETLANLMLAQGSTTWGSQMLSASTIKAGNSASTDWASFTGDYNDDAQWIALSYVKVGDYVSAHGASNAQFVSSAISIYNNIIGQWDSTCGGGVWWSKDHTYKNAITNQLFLSLSSLLYVRTGQTTFLNNAETAWNWLLASGMRNSAGLWNDGLTSACQNNGEQTWTYNQGVVLSGLGWLYQSTANTAYLTAAQTTLDAVVSSPLLVQNGYLREPCDNAAANTSNCGNDGSNFKGIFMKHLQYFLDGANSASLNAKYRSFISQQKNGIINFGKNAANDIGSVWYSPDAGGSIWNPMTSAAGLAGLVAAAKYGTC